MDLSAFTTRIPASARARLSSATLERWSAIHAYVVEHGQTDRYDRALRQHVEKACGKWITEQTTQRHLKRMTDAKLLQAHPLLVKPNALGKLFGSFSIFATACPPPGMFIRYTLPGMEPTLEADGLKIDAHLDLHEDRKFSPGLRGFPL